MLTEVKDLEYKLYRTYDDLWAARSERHPGIEGIGRTSHLAMDHLAKLIQEMKPSVIGLYESMNIGANSKLVGIALSEDFAKEWVAANDQAKTWESRWTSRIELMGPTNGLG